MAIRLNAKEKRRLCATGNITVAVRPQAGHKGYAVFVTNAAGRPVAKPHYVKTKSEVGAVVRDMLRMENKCASPSDMADRSRHRSRS